MINDLKYLRSFFCAGFLLGLLFYPEDRDGMFVRNVGLSFLELHVTEKTLEDLGWCHFARRIIAFSEFCRRLVMESIVSEAESVSVLKLK